MKRTKIERDLKKMGYSLLKGRGSKHDAWSNGAYTVYIPRHREINEYTAKAILKEAKGNAL